MAKKAATVADDNFSFCRGMKTHDRYVDAKVDHPDFGFLDTGSYALNALMCGDVYGGYPKNAFIMAAGNEGRLLRFPLRHGKRRHERA